MRYYASLQATPVSNYNCIGKWCHFHILENVGAILGRVFSAIWDELLSGLCHCDQSTGHPMRYYASLEATTVSSYNCFGYWRHFHILKKLEVCVEYFLQFGVSG